MRKEVNGQIVHRQHRRKAVYQWRPIVRTVKEVEFVIRVDQEERIEPVLEWQPPAVSIEACGQRVRRLFIRAIRPIRVIRAIEIVRGAVENLFVLVVHPGECA